MVVGEAEVVGAADVCVGESEDVAVAVGASEDVAAAEVEAEEASAVEDI